MKSFTKNQLSFAGLLFVFTIIFRFILSSTLEEQFFSYAWIIAVIYALLIFIIGWIFGKKDNEYLSLADTGLKFHLITYFICNSIAELWHLFGLASRFEQISTVHYTILYWGLGLLLHFILYKLINKGTIKGLNKNEIFE